MDWITGIATYFLIWWVTIFMVLPLGHVAPEKQQAGHDQGASDTPRLKQKFILNSVLALVIWCLGYLAVWAFDFRPWETFR